MTRRKTASEPYEIRGVDALFGDDLTPTSAVDLLPLSQIFPSPQQPRRYFDSLAMQELVTSVRQHGILQPLLVRQVKPNRYELVAGERRYRAALSAELESVPVVIRELTDEESLQFALLENLQREDLNPIEETEGILQLLALKLNQTPQSVIDLLNQAAHPERQLVDNVIHSSEWKLVLEIFTTVGRFTPESFRTNRLPLLKLPNEVLDFLRKGLIAYTKARAIAKVKGQTQREALLEATVSENLSLAQLKERISCLIDKRETSQENQVLNLKNRVDTTYRLVKRSNIWNDPKRQRRLEKLLSEIEALVSQEKH